MKQTSLFYHFFVWAVLTSTAGCGELVSPDAGVDDTTGGSDTTMDTTPENDGGADSTDEASTDTNTATAQDSWVNINDVAIAGSAGAYTFNVTFESSDIDCTQFADWWEVVTEDGALVYRRILAHPHTAPISGNPVMRSGGPVDVAADQVVIVRGHMNNVGYSGIAMRGSIDGGFAQDPSIGASFAPNIESADPQPDTCIPE